MDTTFLRWITLSASLFGVIGALISALTFDLPVALAFSLGALLAVLNLWLLGRFGARLLSGDGDGSSSARLAGLFFLKFTLFIGIVLGVTLWLPLPPLAFMAGLSVVILAILIGTLFGPSPAREPAQQDEEI